MNPLSEDTLQFTQDPSTIQILIPKIAYIPHTGVNYTTLYSLKFVTGIYECESKNNINNGKIDRGVYNI